MEVKVLEVRDVATFMPIICIRAVPTSEAARYLLRRDGYRGDDTEKCIIVIRPQCNGVSYDPYNWDTDTMRKAHVHIEKNWDKIEDGDVIDVEFIFGTSLRPKLPERLTNPL
jgi:hypothetical protein